jgi:hypothetical protein
MTYLYVICIQENIVSIVTSTEGKCNLPKSKLSICVSTTYLSQEENFRPRNIFLVILNGVSGNPANTVTIPRVCSHVDNWVL